MSLMYIVTFSSLFCRFAVGFVFLISFGSKIRNIAQFQQSIVRFRLLSRSLSNVAAILFPGCELVVVFCLLVGGVLLLPGFVLALLLLLTFTCALLSVLVRKLSISCNCFGASEEPVAVADVWRNVGLIVCALAGYSTTSWSLGGGRSLGVGEWFLAGISALLLCCLLLIPVSHVKKFLFS